MVQTRSSAKGEIKSAQFQLPQIKRTRRSSAVSASSSLLTAPKVRTPKPEKRRHRCVAETTSGARCRFKCLAKGGLCGVHSLPAKLVNEKCPICLDDFKDRKTVERQRCNHYFHKECINEWLKTHHTCPVCRCEIRERHEPTFPEGLNPVHLLLLPLMSSYLNHARGGESRLVTTTTSSSGEPGVIQLHIFYS